LTCGLWGLITGFGLAGWDHRWVIITDFCLFVRCLLGYLGGAGSAPPAQARGIHAVDFVGVDTVLRRVYALVVIDHGAPRSALAPLAPAGCASQPENDC
jgi:hypothetical protein